MNDNPEVTEQAGETGPDPGTEPAPTLSRGKQTLYGSILVVGLVAAIWMGYSALVPADCGCTRSRKSVPTAQPGGPLVADFRVAVLAYPGRPDAIDAIQAHVASLRSAGYAFLTLSRISEAVRNGERLPQRSVAITLDAESKAIVDDLLVFVRMARVPVSLVVRPHKVGKRGMIGWDLVPELLSYGVEVHAAADTGRGQAALAKDLRTFARRVRPAQPHVVWDAYASDSGGRGSRRAAPAGARTVWRSGTRPVTPMGEGDRLDTDRPTGRPLILDRVHIAITLDADSVVKKVNAITGQPDPEQMAAQHAGAASIRPGTRPNTEPKDKGTGTNK